MILRLSAFGGSNPPPCMVPAKKSENMKKTGPTKNSSRMLIRAMEKAAVERKQAIWKTISVLLGKPRRLRAEVNLQKLARLSKRFSGKTLVVPGKIIGNQVLEEKISVAALEWSDAAQKRIEDAKGKVVSLQELLGKKEKPGQLVLIK